MVPHPAAADAREARSSCPMAVRVGAPVGVVAVGSEGEVGSTAAVVRRAAVGLRGAGDGAYPRGLRSRLGRNPRGRDAYLRTDRLRAGACVVGLCLRPDPVGERARPRRALAAYQFHRVERAADLSHPTRLIPGRGASLFLDATAA